MHTRRLGKGRMAGIFFIGITEVVIGIWAVFLILLHSYPQNSTAHLYFRLLAILSSSVSIGLGVGLISLKKRARNFLIVFSVIILLNKFLLFLGVSDVSSFVEFEIADYVRHSFSLCYHVFIIVFLNLSSVKTCFLYSKR